MDVDSPSPPYPTLTYLMPQSDVPNLPDTCMQTSPSFPKAKYLWEAFNCAKKYASEAQDRTLPPLPIDAESTDKSCHCKVFNSPATPITPTICCHSPTLEAPCQCYNSKDSYDNCKDPSHLLYQYN